MTRAIDLQVGDPVYTEDGRICGEVVHVQPGTVYLDLGFPTPTIITGPSMRRTNVRLGNMRVFFDGTGD